MNFTKRLAVIAIGIGFLSIGGLKLRQQMVMADQQYGFDFLKQQFVPSFDERVYKTMLKIQETVQEGESLQMDVPIADLKLVTSQSHEAQVEVQMAAKDWEKAQSFYEKLNFTARYTNGAIVVKANRMEGNWDSWRTGHARFRVIVHIPETFDVEAKTSAGDIEAGNLRGNVQLISSAGDLDVKDMVGGDIALRTSAGDVNTQNLQGNIEISTSAGDIQMGDVAANGVLSVRTSAGDIDAQDVRADEINIETSAGDISVKSMNGRSVLESNAGDIQIEEMEGALEASTNAGNIEVNLQSSHALKLRSNVGDIDIRAPHSFRADLDLEGSDLHLDLRGEFSGRKSDRTVKGIFNGGGVEVHARSQMGSVSLQNR